ncbi:hypothetical protein ANN_08192 [Periplaneta americana]|uniref:Per a allergen n=1 Tax=Periplaneta americana TaxID=6978 RepID=A0ABQ8T1X4_PERAM|nr:hypothetical protein ANN_08192 [Periplaneta americana]
MDTRCRPVGTVVQQGEIGSIPATSYESTIVHYVFRGHLFESYRGKGCLSVVNVMSYVANFEGRHATSNNKYQKRNFFILIFLHHNITSPLEYFA